MEAMLGSSSAKPTDDPEPLLRAEGISKRFSGVTALAGVNFHLERGEVRALVGENGAGKSTLIKILTGAVPPSDGRIWFEGRPVQFRSPQEAQAAGAVAVHQEVQLLEGRSVAENIYFGREPRRWGLIDWKRMNEETRQVLAKLDLNIDPRVAVGSLNIALRQMVSIARCVSLGAKLVVFDEPTSSLTTHEVSTLYKVMSRLKADGIGMIYISHRFDELYAVCDSVTVLRDGKLAATRELAGLERIDLVCLMLGKGRDELRAGTTAFGRHPAALEETAPLLRAENLSETARLKDVSVEVRRGEIVGLAGLLGSGRTETARVIFGADHADAGKVYFKGKELRTNSPRDAIRAGMGFVAEDRKRHGIIPELSVADNLTLAALPQLARFGFISRTRHRKVVAQFVQRLRIKVSSPSQRIRELSGGNQQKVLFARWLCRNPQLLILDEPTRGIDIGARNEIQALVRELVEAGLGVLMISSELEELVEACSRVVVLRDGRQVAELHGEGISQQAVIHAMADDN
jgi:galactofuranose transport system ATP-binding protein